MSLGRTASSAIAIFLLAASCDRQPAVVGSVIDVHGQPIQGAKVLVERTQFAAASDRNGEFKLHYVPGRFTITTSADGYLSASMDLELSQPARLPLAPISLLPLPRSSDLEAILKAWIPELRGENIWRTGSEKFFTLSESVEVLSLAVYQPLQVSADSVQTVAEVEYRAKVGFNSNSFVWESFVKVLGDNPSGQRKKDEVWKYAFSATFRINGDGTPTLTKVG